MRLLVGARAASLSGRRIAPIAALVLLVNGGSALAQQTEGIAWDESRPLVWADFRGPVDPDAPPMVAAMTAATISLGYEFEMRHNGHCEFEITKIETAAVFHPELSWARDAARIEAVLEHEQGHFDLTEVFRSILERDVRQVVGDVRRCPSGADLPAVEDEAEALVGDVREKVFVELDRVQTQYDAETAHGSLPDAQTAWSTKIRDALGSGSW